MNETDTESRLFRVIAHHLNNAGLQKAVMETVEGLPSTDLHQELATISRCIEQTNQLILNPSTPDDVFVGIKNTRRIIGEAGLDHLPNPFDLTDKSMPWPAGLIKKIVRVGNTETGSTYPLPEKIKGGDTLGIFRWFLYDGVGRATAINLDIPNTDDLQITKGDWITCAISEAAVTLAEAGNQQAQKVVQNLSDIGFFDGWIFTDQMIQRAKIIQS